jgi:hypothetical protein
MTISSTGNHAKFTGTLRHFALFAFLLAVDGHGSLGERAA